MNEADNTTNGNGEVTLEALARMVNNRFDGLDKKVDGLEKKMEERFNVVENELHNVKHRLTDVETNLKDLKERLVTPINLNDLDGRVSYIERKLGIETGK